MKILDPRFEPVLGRLRGFNRKHRLRTKHYDDITDFPETPSIDVLAPEKLDQVDFFTNQDEIFIASVKLVGVLESLDEIVKHPIDLNGVQAYVVEPVTDDDVGYDSDGHPAYSASGYNVLDGKRMRVEEGEETDALFTHLRNTGLLAISDRLVEAAEAAGVRWDLHDEIAHYVPYREHPYRILGVNYDTVRVRDFVPPNGYASVEPAPHPLGHMPAGHDMKGKDPDERWARLLASDDTEAAVARYSMGLELPELHAVLDASSKTARKKQWKSVVKTELATFNGLPVLGEATRDALVERGCEAEWIRCVLKDEELGSEREMWLLRPDAVVEWIDWEKSDVGFRWNGFVAEFHDLHPTEESYEATQPIVRIAGTRLVLIHESWLEVFEGKPGFRWVPLHHHFVCRNLDAHIRG